MSTKRYQTRLLDSLLYALRQQPQGLMVQGPARIGKSAVFTANDAGHLTPKLFHIVRSGTRSDFSPGEGAGDPTTDPEAIS